MRVGVVGDLHEPFTHPMYMQFCEDMFAKWRVDHVHFIGDIVDNHAISYHETDPDGLSGGEEMDFARANTVRWHDLFPGATVSIGNHDALHHRKARSEGIPRAFMRTYEDVWRTPSWDWKFHHYMDGIRFQHGTGSSGRDAAMSQALQRRVSVVQGHTHSWAGAKWHTNDDSRIFGFNVGCGIDIDTYAMEYGKDFPNRPVLGCGVIDSGVPFFLPMFCGPREPYHRNKAKRRRK